MSKIREIIDSYGYKTELHSHTMPVSNCGHVTAAETVANYLWAGCDALVITNHLNPEKWLEGDPAVRAEEYLSDYYLAKDAARGTELEVILGVEIRFSENPNDYLVYGVDPAEVEKMIYYIDRGISEFYRNFKNTRNIILQAHPFRKNMVKAPLDSIDGIETFNVHPNHNSRIAIAAKYAAENGLFVSGGSDNHEPDTFALCLMRSKTKPRDSFDVAEILKSKNFLFDMSGHIVFPFGY